MVHSAMTFFPGPEEQAIAWAAVCRKSDVALRLPWLPLLAALFGPDKPDWRSPFMGAKQTLPIRASTSENDPCRKPRFFDGLQLRCRDHPNLNGPNPGAANPNDTGFLPAVGGTFRLEALTSTLSDADCSWPSPSSSRHGN